MLHKYFKINCKNALDEIESCLLFITTRDSALKDLADKFGAKDCLQFNGGGVAAFSFNVTPDRSVWKKVKHGYMPKVKTNENRELNDIPPSKNHNGIIRKFGFGDEMLEGENTGRGFRIHSSYLKGNRKTNDYFIIVPYQDTFDKEANNDLTEVKKWEMIKALDEATES